ncbi:MAG TPA: MBOAT family protein [Niabella sp.]|nr:MBOAT family protein [Niabella sp.]
MASLAFYTYWSPVHLILLLGSIAFNYAIAGRAVKTDSKSWVHIGVLINLLVLAYFKYALFIGGIASDLAGRPFDLGKIVLPLGISFFTFHQITYLYDTYNKNVPRVGLRDYILYISFFPQLIAGPVVRAHEFLPQLTPYKGDQFFWRNNAVGLSLFAMGLFKKVVFADQFAIYANQVFDDPAKAQILSSADSWVGALAYTFQLYFDFSGYSDMALGLALMFGFKLPINFYSPYKAGNIAEFWKRWHMTMSRFFRDYLYIPLGGSRCSKKRHIFNLVITMTLVGLWHGAGWTFILWGFLHGVYLAIHRTYRWIVKEHPFTKAVSYKIFAQILTFICVVFAWVIFRAENAEQAGQLIENMWGITNTDIVYHGGRKAIVWILAGYIACLLLPSSMAFFRFAGQEGPITLRFSPNAKNMIMLAFTFGLSLLMLTRVSEFLYFEF